MHPAAVRHGTLLSHLTPNMAAFFLACAGGLWIYSKMRSPSTPAPPTTSNGGWNWKGLAVVAVLAVGAVVLAGPHHGHHKGGILSLLSAGPTAPTGSKAKAAAAVRDAKAQIGKPYGWGATGPGVFDCSGLTMTAYRAAGIAIPRTSQKQWAWGPKVAAGQEKRGDLVFFAGSDGTASAPGHVGIVVDPARHLMVEAYASGFPVRLSHYGTSNSAPGDQQVAGFTRPSAH